MDDAAKTVSWESYVDFLSDFYSESALSLFKDQRFGQAFCNRFDIADSKLFYEEKASQAISLAARHVQAAQ